MNLKDDEGLTPLDIAQENMNEECIRLLFKAQQPEILVSNSYPLFLYGIGSTMKMDSSVDDSYSKCDFTDFYHQSGLTHSKTELDPSFGIS